MALREIQGKNFRLFGSDFLLSFVLSQRFKEYDISFAIQISSKPACSFACSLAMPFFH